VNRIALTRKEAAAALGVSLTFFERKIQPDLRIIRKGSVRLVPVAELERWVETNAGTPARELMRNA
jgi:excisionase family DNA binding protein